ncbi:MAG: alkaline phosphatase PhoX [Synechococcales bacterium]|nr:alkaline phosphatase PhoX [Synechococcales bacterium]
MITFIGLVWRYAKTPNLASEQRFMSLQRREFLLFMGAAIGTVGLNACTPTRQSSLPTSQLPEVGFKPLQGPMPLETGPIALADQVSQLANYEIKDDLILPEGYTYQILGTWGDKIGDSRFGYNNDYLSLIETAPNEGFLAINFEYISAIPWVQHFEQIIGTKLPIAAVAEALKKTDGKGIDAFSLPAKDPLKQQIATICQEALIDQGVGIISIRRNAQGQWERTYSTADRRITGISGLTDGRYLTCTGPARAVFRKQSGQGYVDKLGDRLIGTFANCAGGTTPWGTMLTAEENIQTQVPEPVYADGTSFEPKQRRVNIDAEEVSGQGNVFGLAGNKYGWIVEIDPANAQDYGTKHTWLGRYRHEAVGVRVETGKPLAFYSGCDRRGGHLYKFVSKGKVNNPKDKANSKLLSEGMLYAAQLNEDGTGKWIPLKPDTPVNPILPSYHIGDAIALPKRPAGGYTLVSSDDEAKTFAQQYKTLGDLYNGTPEEKQGAILIDAHYAANACGATCTARPEDTEIAPDGSLYIAFTSGSGSEKDGGPDQRIFKGPKGETPYEYGFIMHLTETNNQPDALTFQWKMMALGGEPASGGAGFANPDNLLIDPTGNVWVVTDMSSGVLNQAVSDRTSSTTDLRGTFGNNGLWMIPTQGKSAGNAYLFALGPMDCELTGPFLSGDRQALFLAVQHPGEVNGMRQDMKSEIREFVMKAPNGQEFQQKRTVPIGSNFPANQANQPPKPAVVVITRQDRSVIA